MLFSVLEVVSKRVAHTGWKRLRIEMTGFIIRRLMACGPSCVLQGGMTINSDRGTQRQFWENICSEDDLQSRIFGTLIVISCLPTSPRIFEHLKNGIIA